jgi:hypothetical protein
LSPIPWIFDSGIEELHIHLIRQKNRFRLQTE